MRGRTPRAGPPYGGPRGRAYCGFSGKKRRKGREKKARQRAGRCHNKSVTPHKRAGKKIRQQSKRRSTAPAMHTPTNKARGEKPGRPRSLHITSPSSQIGTASRRMERTKTTKSVIAFFCIPTAALDCRRSTILVWRSGRRSRHCAIRRIPGACSISYRPRPDRS